MSIAVDFGIFNIFLHRANCNKNNCNLHVHCGIERGPYIIATVSVEPLLFYRCVLLLNSGR